MPVPTEPSQRDFCVAIVGGGICGVILAIGLRRAGIKVDIFEAASRYGEVGAGIGIGPNAVRILDYLGILDEVAAHTAEKVPDLHSFRFHTGWGNHELVYTYPARPDDLRLGLHRAAFLDALVTFLDSEMVTTHFNKRCVKVVPSTEKAGLSVIHFADGTSHETNLVVGADGIRSTVRQFVADEDAPTKTLSFSSCSAYRGLIHVSAFEKAGVETPLHRWPALFMGDGQHMITFPLAKGIVNVVVFDTDFDHPIGSLPSPDADTWVKPTTVETVHEVFSGFSDEPHRIISCMEKPTKWAIHVVHPHLKSFVRKNVVIIGDAAHAMLPFLGAGAGQGIEDAWVLSRLLTHPQTCASTLEAVLRAHNRVRVPRGTFVAAQSKLAGEIFEGHGPSGASVEGQKADVENIWDRVWHHDINADIESSIAQLTEDGVFV
ncbi:FAD/NAD-P-binding domain-containing protein [Gloeopeniophorella convolvens]|nr:FAD/NAD-P-binding domain-containing protein [Gloeopeniophorella convolvens]